MQGEISVTVTSVTITTDDDGNSTSATATADVDGVMFAPRASSERVDSRAPAVITGATLYKRGSGLVVTREDIITIADVSPMIDGDWQVDGEGGYWGAMGTEVAIKRVGS